MVSFDMAKVLTVNFSTKSAVITLRWINHLARISGVKRKSVIDSISWFKGIHPAMEAAVDVSMARSSSEVSSMSRIVNVMDMNQHQLEAELSSIYSDDMKSILEDPNIMKLVTESAVQEEMKRLAKELNISLTNKDIAREGRVNVPMR